MFQMVTNDKNVHYDVDNWFGFTDIIKYTLLMIKFMHPFCPCSFRAQNYFYALKSSTRMREKHTKTFVIRKDMDS